MTSKRNNDSSGNKILASIGDEIKRDNQQIECHVDGPAYNDQGGSDDFENWGNEASMTLV